MSPWFVFGFTAPGSPVIQVGCATDPLKSMNVNGGALKQCWPVESKRRAQAIVRMMRDRPNELKWHFMGSYEALQTFIRLHLRAG